MEEEFEEEDDDNDEDDKERTTEGENYKKLKIMRRERWKDQPVQHGGVKMDCFKKIENEMLAMSVLAVGSWAAFYTKHNIGDFFLMYWMKRHIWQYKK
eukprot:15367132-Ditylum_brightwellii.AAC.1